MYTEAHLKCKHSRMQEMETSSLYIQLPEPKVLYTQCEDNTEDRTAAIKMQSKRLSVEQNNTAAARSPLCSVS